MFICNNCIDKFEGSALSYAKMVLEVGGLGTSYGPCESCRKTSICVDAHGLRKKSQDSRCWQCRNGDHDHCGDNIFTKIECSCDC